MADPFQIPAKIIGSAAIVIALFLIWGERLMDVFDRIRRWYSNLHRDRDGVVRELAREIGDARIPVLELPSLGISVEEAALNIRRMTELLQREHSIPHPRFEARVRELAQDLLADSIEDDFIYGTELDNRSPIDRAFQSVSMTSPPTEQLNLPREPQTRCSVCFKFFPRRDMHPSEVQSIPGTRTKYVEFLCHDCAKIKNEPQLPKVRVVRMGKIERR